MKLTGNKGDWSELYALIRLLADGKIYAADENLLKNEKCHLPILKIFRADEQSQRIEYRRNNKNTIELYLNGAFVRKIATEELARMAEFFYSATVHGKGKGAFKIAGAEEIMQTLKCQRIKAVSDGKVDIEMEVHDPFTNYNRICGYSIKSDIGNPPSLFNASHATNFKFEVLGIGDDEAERINAIHTQKKIRDRVRNIGEMRFIAVTNENFAKNLMFLDTQMEKFLAEMLLMFYREGIADCAELANIIDERDPLGLKLENIYPHKIKKFLCAVALGLQPAKKWNGQDAANGGYIIVKESGEVLAYHLYDRDSFENYLLNNTKFDTPSSTKHNFGKIYSENGKKFINFNLQIRFK